jgi:hypothetical protein
LSGDIVHAEKSGRFDVDVVLKFLLFFEYMLFITTLILMGNLSINDAKCSLFHISHFTRFQYTRDLWVPWWYYINVGNMHLESGHALPQRSGVPLLTGVNRMVMVQVHMNGIFTIIGEINCTE